MRAWPAAQQLLFDGWVARLSDGYTKRANSASLLYPQTSVSNLEPIEPIETLYRSQGLPVIFRLLSFTTPAEFDPWLANRGYRECRRHAGHDRRYAARGGAGPCSARDGCRARDRSARAHERPLLMVILPKHRRILERIPSGLSFVGLFERDELVACGLSVLDGDLAGLFDIVTDPAHRRKGHGARLVRGMIAQAASQGAATVYLQVVMTNEPAIALYRSLGFTEAYRYTYRICE